MKHYYRPIDYYGTRFTQPIYSPVDGLVLYLIKPSGSGADAWKADYIEQTGKKPPTSYRDWNIVIRPEAAPNVWITHMHLSPIDEIVDAVPLADARSRIMATARPASPGYRVRAGDLIGHGLGEIIVKRHLDGAGVPSPCNSNDARSRLPMSLAPGCQAKVQLHSAFEFMTDEVFAEYQKIANVSRSDFMISEESRGENPLVCEGESFVRTDTENNSINYVQLQPESSQETREITKSSAAGRPQLADLAQGRTVIVSLENLGSQVVGPIATEHPYILAIADDGGPIEISVIYGSSNERSVYQRPAGTTGFSSYESPPMESGQITISVKADPSVNWIVAIIQV